MNLYELNQNINELNELYEQGELTEQCLNDTIESMGGTTYDKMENIVKFLRSKESEQAALKAEADHFAKRARTAANSATYWKDYLKTFLQSNGKDKADAGIFKLSIRTNAESLIVDDLTKIPAEFFKPQDPKLDKVSLKKAIKDQKEMEIGIIPGAHLERSKSLQIK